jgi:hypothetical protein
MLQLPTSGVPTLENEGNTHRCRDQTSIFSKRCLSWQKTRIGINPDPACVPNGLELDVKFSLEFLAPILSRRPGTVGISKRLRVYGAKQ